MYGLRVYSSAIQVLFVVRLEEKKMKYTEIIYKKKNIVYILILSHRSYCGLSGFIYTTVRMYVCTIELNCKIMSEPVLTVGEVGLHFHFQIKFDFSLSLFFTGIFEL